MCRVLAWPLDPHPPHPGENYYYRFSCTLLPTTRIPVGDNDPRAGKQPGVRLFQHLPDVGSPHQCRHHRKRHKPLVQHGRRRCRQEDANGRGERVHAIQEGVHRKCRVQIVGNLGTGNPLGTGGARTPRGVPIEPVGWTNKTTFGSLKEKQDPGVREERRRQN